MHEFLPPLIGGILIGLAASLLLLFKGRIFGITGILFGTITKNSLERNWRLAIIAGLLTGGFFVYQFDSSYFDYEFNSSLSQMAIAGFLVGLGTRLGSGCTSGHGVCGLARLSKRSLAATLTFMAAGIVTVWLVGGV